MENFPGSSVGRESACNAGDPSSIRGSGRSSGEQIGYPLQYSQASLVAHLVMNPPTMWKTWVWSLGWEDPLKKEDSYPLLYSGLENSMDCSLWGHKELDMTERLSLHFTSLPYFLFLFHFLFIFFIVYWVTKSWTWLRDFHFTLLHSLTFFSFSISFSSSSFFFFLCPISMLFLSLRYGQTKY